MTTLNITVTVSPAGQTINDGLNWSFAPGPGAPAGSVLPDGTIDLNTMPAGETDITWTLAGTLNFTSGPFSGTNLPWSFFGGQQGALDAILMGTANTNKAHSLPPEFSSATLGEAYQSLTIDDHDDDRSVWYYGLVIFVLTNENGSNTGRTFQYDPPIKNKTN
jgi:hypothetical protein